MAKTREILEFAIKDAWSPETLPMSRLAEYLSDLAIILGEKEHVHFLEVAEGSALARCAVEPESTPKVRQRVHDVRTGDADQAATEAQARIDKRLRQDGAFGYIRVVHKEQDSNPDAKEGGRLLFFPGASAAQSPQYGPFNQVGQLYGVPINIGGKQALANVNLEDGDRTYYCEANRDIALQLAPLMFNHRVRVHGIGRYMRDPEGDWILKKFRINSFDKLHGGTLDESVRRLRVVTSKNGLDKDIIDKLDKLREA